MKTSTNCLRNSTLQNCKPQRAFSLAIGIATSIFQTASSQAVTEIVTDYNGFWKSSSSSVNTVKPASSHNLLAFMYNGIRYSTGANDGALFSAGLTYVAGDFRALNAAGLSGTPTANTKVALGALYDGIVNGAPASSPTGSMTSYLTDGIKGLNLGTGVANLPAGNLTFTVSGLQLSNVGDGKPDILITQIADPSTTADSYRFTDAAGNTVGAAQSILFSNIGAVGNWTVDFYEASSFPMNLLPGFTQTDRPLRLWAADFSDFGITALNYTSIQRFSINLSGNSDMAFVAYSNSAVTLLPMELISFTARGAETGVSLDWKTASEENMNRYEVEWSANGTSFSRTGTVTAKNTSGETSYNYIHANAAATARWYRLKQVENNGKFTYSRVVQVAQKTEASLSMYPNPAYATVNLSHPSMSHARIEIWNAAGQRILTKTASEATSSQIVVSRLTPGAYQLVWKTDAEQKTISLLKQ